METPALIVERWRWSFDGRTFSVRILDRRHPRASVDEIRDHVGDTSDKPEEWYMAQMCHYGRFPAVPPLSLSLNKKNLKEAVENGQLFVPEGIVQLEQELAGEWAAAAEAGKTGMQKMDTPEKDHDPDGDSLTSEGLEIAARLLRKQGQASAEVYNGDNTSAEEPEVVLFPAVTPQEEPKSVNEPAQPGATLSMMKMLSRSDDGNLQRPGSATAGSSQNLQAILPSDDQYGREVEGALGSATSTSGRPTSKAGAAVSASDEVILISSDEDSDSVIELPANVNQDPGDTHESSRKDWRRGHSNSKRARHGQGMMTARSALVVRGDQQRQQAAQIAPRTFAPLGRLSGLYRVLCSSISAYGGDPCKLHMILAATDNIIRGAFDFGPIHGYMRTNRLPSERAPRCIPFQWRGIDDANRVFNREEDGSCLTFFGNGGICGTLCWPNVEHKFEAVVLSSPDEEDENVHQGKAQSNAMWIDEYWEKLNTAAMT